MTQRIEVLSCTVSGSFGPGYSASMGGDGLIPTDDDAPPGPDDLDRWRRRQEQFSGIHILGSQTFATDGGHEQVVVLTSELARLLWEFADDGALWKQLKKNHVDLAQATEEQRVRLMAMTRIEWASFLPAEAHGPSPSKVSDEFRIDVQRAIENPGSVNVNDLRRRVKTMATRLDQALSDDRPGAFRRLAARLRQALPGAARAGVVHGVAAAAGGATAGQFGPLAGKAAGAATARGLDRALPKTQILPQRQQVDWQVRNLVSDELHPDLIAKGVAEAQELLSLHADKQHRSLLAAAAAAGNEELFGSVLTRVDRCIAVLFVVWSRLENDGRTEFVGEVADAVDWLLRLRAILADVSVATMTSGELLRCLSTALVEIYEKLAWHK